MEFSSPESEIQRNLPQQDVFILFRQRRVNLSTGTKQRVTKKDSGTKMGAENLVRLDSLADPGCLVVS